MRLWWTEVNVENDYRNTYTERYKEKIIQMIKNILLIDIIKK